MNRYCRVCQKEGNVELLYTENNYNITRCRICKFISSDPIPSSDELEEYYSSNYYSGEESQAKTWDGCRNRLFLQTLKILKKRGISEHDTILDIGCGYGAFLNFASKTGFTIEGIDISKSAIKYIKEKLHLRVWQGELGVLPLQKGRFKAITMLDVLEHLPDFMDKLKNAYDLLTVNGLIYIRVPNMNFHLAKMKIFKLIGSKWKYGMFDPPAHLNHFTPEILEHILKKTGYQIDITLNGVPSWNGGIGRKAGLVIIGAIANVIHYVFGPQFLIGNSLIVVGRKK